MTDGLYRRIQTTTHDLNCRTKVTRWPDSYTTALGAADRNRTIPGHWRRINDD